MEDANGKRGEKNQRRLLAMAGRGEELKTEAAVNGSWVWWRMSHLEFSEKTGKRKPPKSKKCRKEGLSGKNGDG